MHKRRLRKSKRATFYEKPSENPYAKIYYRLASYLIKFKSPQVAIY